MPACLRFALVTAYVRSFPEALNIYHSYASPLDRELLAVVRRLQTLLHDSLIFSGVGIDLQVGSPSLTGPISVAGRISQHTQRS